MFIDAKSDISMGLFTHHYASCCFCIRKPFILKPSAVFLYFYSSLVLQEFPFYSRIGLHLARLFEQGNRSQRSQTCYYSTRTRRNEYMMLKNFQLNQEWHCLLYIFSLKILTSSRRNLAPSRDRKSTEWQFWPLNYSRSTSNGACKSA